MPVALRSPAVTVITCGLRVRRACRDKTASRIRCRSQKNARGIVRKENVVRAAFAFHRRRQWMHVNVVFDTRRNAVDLIRAVRIGESGNGWIAGRNRNHRRQVHTRFRLTSPCPRCCPPSTSNCRTDRAGKCPRCRQRRADWPWSRRWYLVWTSRSTPACAAGPWYGRTREPASRKTARCSSAR